MSNEADEIFYIKPLESNQNGSFFNVLSDGEEECKQSRANNNVKMIEM